jgi:polar amino acid transport system substrate-binding protein
MRAVASRFTKQFLIAVCSAWVSIHASAQNNKMLTACAGHTPPFILFFDGQPVGGFSFELLMNLSHQMGMRLSVRQLPWARCLQQVRLGKIDLAIDAYEDAERRKVFHYSNPYYTLTPQVFYRANDPAMSPELINSRAGLMALKGCGVQGYTYDHYGIDALNMDLGAANDLKMLMKLKAGHCDYALEELEYVIGARQGAGEWMDESALQSFQPAWARGPKVHFLIGKDNATGERLLQSLNRAIGAAQFNGTLASLQKRFFDKATKR